MLDIQFIEQHKDAFQQSANDRGISISVEDLLSINEQRKSIQQEIEVLKHEQKQANNTVAQATPKERATLITNLKTVANSVKEKEEEQRTIQKKFKELMLMVPNIPDESVPIGEGETANVVRKEATSLPPKEETPKSHLELMEQQDMLDIKRGVKIVGNRGYFLKNDGALINNAALQHALQFAREKGFTILDAPLIANEEFLEGIGHFPNMQDETFEVYDKEKQQFLIGTSEVPLMGFHANEVLNEEDLPIKLAALTPAFRTEVGSYGKDTQGLYRVRQFYKVEQIIICKNDPEESKKHFDELMNNAEEFLQGLELPYQCVQKGTGDMGQGKVEEWDIETYMPSREGFGETHTCSRLHSFQTRRLNIKYKTKDGKKVFAHSLNNTLAATPRLLIPLLEIHQQENGTIKVPKALQPYTHKETLGKL